MSLSAREARVLGAIESELCRDRGLTPMFETFTRLTRDEPIAGREQLRSRRSRVLAALLLPVILASGAIAALSGGRGQGPAGCSHAPAVFGLHWRDRAPCPPTGGTRRAPPAGQRARPAGQQGPAGQQAPAAQPQSRGPVVRPGPL
jgi:hypothetical protein